MACEESEQSEPNSAKTRRAKRSGYISAGELVDVFLKCLFALRVISPVTNQSMRYVVGLVKKLHFLTCK